MKYLEGAIKQIAKRYLDMTIEIAQQSKCLRSRCGAIIVNPERGIIGEGFNSPPLNRKPEFCIKDKLPVHFKSDRTCCVHAEQRAIMNVRNKDDLKGAILYFIRTDLSGKRLEAGKPYCTICSKMILDSGISWVILWDRKGPRAYSAEEFNEISFQYRGE